MNNISLIYYTANLAHDYFAKNVRDRLIEDAQGKPIISVSQKPIDFGENIYAEGFIPCLHNVYKQILIGAKKAKTKYVACCEDDTLYGPEHFEYEPPENTFCYNINHWYIRPGGRFYKIAHRIMGQCIVSTEYMVETLETRFEKYPNNVHITGAFGELGIGEHKLGLPEVGIGVFETEIPPIAFKHRYGLSGIRKIPERYSQCEELPYWGNAKELWDKVYG